MAISDLTKQALRKLNIQVVWTVLMITVFCGLLDYAIMFSGGLGVSKEIIGLGHLVVFAVWVVLMLILLSKWLYKQIIARRK